MTSRSKILAPLKIVLGLSLAVSGVPGLDGRILLGVGTAQQAAAQARSSMIKINQVGPGVTRKIKLGLNKAVVIDLPTDANDILVADPGISDAVTRTSRRLYIFGK